MQYAFVLGREPAISTAELIAALNAADAGFDAKTSIFTPAVMIATVEKQLDAEFFHRLGGSIKMARVVKESQAIDKDLLKLLGAAAGDPTSPDGLRGARTNLDFGLSLYDMGAEPARARMFGKWLKPLSLELKKELKAGGLSVRAVLADGLALTSVQVDKNKLVSKGAEFLILAGPKTTWLARTIAVQAFEDFSERDFGRPNADAKSGMLPPKLARMMINIAAGPETETLMDAFCGSGTVLNEAATLGYRDLVGSDLSEKAISDTKANFAWLVKERGLKVDFEAFVSDVKDLPQHVKPGSISTIVSEPYLGPPLKGGESDQKIHFEYLELMGLYRRTFDAFSKILKPGGKVVFVFPVFGSKHVNIRRELEDYGFRAEGLLPGMAVTALNAHSSTGLVYKRPDQRVGRDIFRFRFNPNR